MQVLARVRHRHLARLGRMLEVMMAAGRADIEPAVRFKLANNITRILAHRTPRLQPKVAWDGAVGKCLSRLLPIVIKRHQLPRYRLRRIGRQERRTKQGVDGRDFRREDGASRLMPAHSRPRLRGGRLQRNPVLAFRAVSPWVPAYAGTSGDRMRSLHDRRVTPSKDSGTKGKEPVDGRDKPGHDAA
jgi:hypothetical protein